MNNLEPHYENTAPPEGGAGKDNSMKLLAASVLISAVILSGSWIYLEKNKTSSPAKTEISSRNEAAKLTAQIVPTSGIELPVRWANVAKAAADSGVLDRAAFEALYKERGGVPEDILKALNGEDGNLKITGENSGALLNVLWAVGLGQKSTVLTQGSMQDKRYGGAGNFASTGGWTLAKGKAMNHYAMHEFMHLDAEAQGKVDDVAEHIFRPCCGNSTHFPDCNHGMAMLGLLEMMASQGASKEDMYKAALALNRFWFPDTYANAAKYLASEGLDWQKADPKDLLAAEFSSSQGAANIKSQLAPSTQQSGGGGCGV